MTDTETLVAKQLAEYGIQFGEKYQDPASGFEGTVTALYFYKHGCLRVSLRGGSHTGEPVEFTFDAPELTAVPTGF